MRPVNTQKKSQLEDALLKDFHLKDDNNTVLISEMDSKVNGSFAIHSMLSLFMKENYHVCFLSLSQSFAHYHLVSQKLGTDLKLAQDSQKLIVIDGLQYLGSSVIQDCIDTKSSPSMEFNSIISTGSLDGLLEMLTVNIDRLFTQASLDDSPVAVVIDDISTLSSVGVMAKDIVLFTHLLSKHLHQKKGGALVFLSSLFEGDEKSECLMSYLNHISTINLSVKSLPSGYCKDVHGELTITRRRRLGQRKKVQKVWQFKVTDKNVNLMSSGLSSAVL